MMRSSRWRRWGLASVCLLAPLAVLFAAFPPDARSSGEWPPARLWRLLTGRSEQWARAQCIQNLKQISVVGFTYPGPTPAAARRDSPMLGGTPSRNLVNLVDKSIPTSWSVEDGKLQNVKWVAKIGNRGYGSPVVADGRVFVSTNNKAPRDKQVKGKKAVLMCFAEKDGKFLWQAVH